MAAATTTAAALSHLYSQTPPPSLSSCKSFSLSKQRRSNLSFGINLYSPIITSTSSTVLLSTSSTETSLVEDDQEIDTPLSDNSDPSASLPPFTGCKACGKAEIENGCNGEGRIQGGIATVPGFGWWPIKAYRPCPEFVASGGRYRRTGQTMDDVVSGGGRPKIDRTQSSKKVKGPKKVKK